MTQIPGRKLCLIILIGLLLTGGGIVAFRSEPPFVPLQPSVAFLPPNSKMPAQPSSFFERWVPITWSWLWRLRDSLRGPVATILMDTQIIDCTALSEHELAGLLLQPALAETNGLRGWILQDAALTQLRLKLERLGGSRILHPRVQTSHRVQSSMSVGEPSFQVGLALDFLPLIQRDGTDLMTIFTVTEAIANRTAATRQAEATGESTRTGATSVATNLAAAARWKFPDGTGFFVLGPVPSDDSRRIGVIVSATIERPGK